MSYRVVLRPDEKNLGIFNDSTDEWVYRTLGDWDAADVLWDTEGLDPDEGAKMITQLRAKRLSDEYDRYVMNWAEAEWRAGGRHGSRPLDRDAKGLRLMTHGSGGWRRGCKCDVCTEAHLEDNRKRYGTAAERTLTHGLSGYAQGCKCDICMNARGGPRARLDAGDVRDYAEKVMVSARERALIAELAAEEGVSISGWFMSLAIPVLEERKGYEDVRRPAPRRPNYKRQPEDERGEDTARRAAPRRRNAKPRAKSGQQREEGVRADGR